MRERKQIEQDARQGVGHYAHTEQTMFAVLEVLLDIRDRLYNPDGK